MTNRDTARWAAVAAVVGTLTVATAPTAAPDPPPPVDDSYLPAPADPAPPAPTRQLVTCSLPALTEAADSSASFGPVEDAVLQQIWQLSSGSGQTVAVIDTGVSRHLQLPGLVGGGDYVSTGDGTHDCDGHGTIVAGIIAARHDPSGANGFVGLAPEVRLLSIRQTSSKFGVQGPAGPVPGLGDLDTLAMAVRTAADLGATVISITAVACVPGRTMDDRALGAALAYAVEVQDAVVVSSAGNHTGPSSSCEQNPGNADGRQPVPNWTDLNSSVSPARYDDYVLAVGSVGPDGAASDFSLAGPWVDVAALGESVVSLDPDGEGLVNTTAEADGATVLSGTSFATPVVSAVAALVRSRFPELTAREVMRRIEDTARPGPAGWDPFIGNGVVDPLAAISAEVPIVEPKPVATVPVSPPQDSNVDDGPARRSALTGAALCVVALGSVFALRSASARLRHRATSVPALDRDTRSAPYAVAPDQRVGATESRPARQ
ncbi:MAG: type VII secretion-associated serine protease mycosin [Mycobacterium sp.]